MILIADSGSTKTDWVLMDKGVAQRRIATEGINPFFIGEDAIVDIVNSQLLPMMNATPDQIYFYGTGCADDVSSGRVLSALTVVFPSAEIRIYSDLVGAARGLCGRSPGIACILGTGANNSVYDGNTITANIGSLGFWMGDEGSGGYLGKTLLASYLHQELPPDIYEDFKVAYPEIDRLVVLENAYRKPFPNRYFASFTPFVAQHLSNPSMAEMVKRAFGLFLDKYVIKHPESARYPVHFTGSVAWYFSTQLEIALVDRKLKPGKIEKSPMPGLLEYHA